MTIMRTKRVVTKKFGEVVFEAPGLLGDAVEIWCRAERFGVTSLTLDCRVLARSIEPEHVETISRSTVVYVALDESGQATRWHSGEAGPVPPPMDTSGNDWASGG